MNKLTVSAIIAVLWTVGTIVILFCAMLGIFKAPIVILTLGLNGLFGICGYIVGYYFGSSASSKGKDDIIRSITNSP